MSGISIILYVFIHGAALAIAHNLQLPGRYLNRRGTADHKQNWCESQKLQEVQDYHVQKHTVIHVG